MKIGEALRSFLDEEGLSKKISFGGQLSFTYDPIKESIDFFDVRMIKKDLLGKFHKYLAKNSIEEDFIKNFDEDWLDELK